MNISCGQRLAEWRKNQGLSQRALGSALGVSQGYIGNIEADRSEPSRNFLQSLSERFGVSSDWILYGVGLPNSERASGFGARKPGKRIEPPDLGMPYSGDFRFGSENFFLIERMDLSISAGVGLIPTANGEHEMMAFPRSWIISNRVNPDLSFLVRVKGDSMAPTIPDGALVLVDGTDRDLGKSGIFAFNRGEASFVKRLVSYGHQPDGSHTAIKVLSDNPAFSPDALVGEEMNEIRIVGRVRCVMVTM